MSEFTRKEYVEDVFGYYRYYHGEHFNFYSNFRSLGSFSAKAAEELMRESVYSGFFYDGQADYSLENYFTQDDDYDVDYELTIYHGCIFYDLSCYVYDILTLRTADLMKWCGKEKWYKRELLSRKAKDIRAEFLTELLHDLSLNDWKFTRDCDALRVVANRGKWKTLLRDSLDKNYVLTLKNSYACSDWSSAEDGNALRELYKQQ